MGSSEVVNQSRMDNAKSVVKDLNPFTNIAISVSQIMCSIQTAINPINFVLLLSSGEWNTVL
jgi:hypothetical protein